MVLWLFVRRSIRMQGLRFQVDNSEGQAKRDPQEVSMDKIEAPHWTLIEPREWPWPHFLPQELASHGDGSVCSVIAAVDALEVLRGYIGRPLTINSAYRDPIYNALCDGAPMSRHKVGDAFDVSLRGLNKFELLDAAKECGFNGIGKYQTFLHIDARPNPIQWYGGKVSRGFWRIDRG